MKKIHRMFLIIIISTFLLNLVLVLLNLVLFQRFFLYSIDADHYLSIAKTFYLDPSVWNDFDYGYFAHLLPYPFLVRLACPIFPEIGLLVVSFSFWIGSLYMFLRIGTLKDVPDRTLSILLLMFAGVYNMYVIYGSTNGGISMIIFLSLVGYYFYLQEKYFISSIFFGLTAMTHVIGVLYAPLFFILLISKKSYWKSFYYLILIPAFFSINCFYFLWVKTVILGYFDPLNFLTFFTSQDITVRRFFPFGMFLGYIFMPIFSEIYPFFPPYRFQFPDVIIYSTVFMCIFIYCVYLSLKRKEDRDLTFIALGFFLFLMHWAWTQPALRLLLIPASVLLFNLSQGFEKMFEEGKSWHKGVILGILIGLFIMECLSYALTIQVLNYLDFLKLL